jgi:erythronate-4-phosphate dehydrogenase
MIIAVDRAIPYWEEAFAELGEIRLFSGRDCEPADVRDADALVVRTITPVGAPLLEGSAVRFVAGASAGVDHVDQEYLKSRGISFSYAAGCNADAVSEYVFTALYVLASRRGWQLKGKSLAVIGVGNVGSRVARKARALGIEALLCDPPLRDTTANPQYRSLDDVLGADIVSLHVPLAHGGSYPTWHLFDRNTLGRLTPRQVLINSARGAVVDNRELKSALQAGKIGGAVLDVWEGEPQIDCSLLEWADIATPHTAGLSLDAKIRATAMARAALCSFFGMPSSWDTDSFFPAPRPIRPEHGTADQDAVVSVLLQVFDIAKDDAALRERAADFDRLRNDRPLRLEFGHFVVDLAERQAGLAETFAALGFKFRM